MLQGSANFITDDTRQKETYEFAGIPQPLDYAV
jgi:hypothetical protein